MTDPEELLDIKEAARLLRVSETSLRRWTNAGALPHLRIGGKRERRFRRSDLLAFLEAGPVSPPAAGFTLGGHPAEAGTHLCGLFRSEPARIAQAAQFVAEGLRAGSTCLMVTSPRARRGIVAELARRVPSLDRELKAGRLVRSDYAPTLGEQLEYFENELGNAVRAGGESLHVLGDLSAGGPERGQGFARIVEYEGDYEVRIARRFPVVTLCQYDARRLSGVETLAMLQCHPDAFQYSASTLPP
jgi:excisionase family DNA binding protein